jgi:hypothetical protein
MRGIALVKFLAPCLLVVLFLIASAAVSYMIAQQPPGSKPGAVTQAPPAAPVAPPAAPAPRPQLTIEQVLYLIRSTLLTLNDANRSGNYSVLRDLAAPDFQARNSAADLALSFTDLRRRNFDLFAAALVAPQLTEPPATDADGRLRLTGVFPTRPLQIKFDLVFQLSAGQWRLLAISVATPDAPALEAQPQGQPPAQKQAPKLGSKATATPAESGRRRSTDVPR